MEGVWFGPQIAGTLIVFLKQSISSDYCAVYATGMLLSLMGVATTKTEAMRLFGVHPQTWTGSTQRQIHDVVSSAIPSVNAHWRRKRPQTSTSFVDMARRSMSAGAPCLVTARCKHRRLGLTCGHVFLITGADRNEVRILDPLGPKPPNGTKFNAVVLRGSDAVGCLVRPQMLAWEIDLKTSLSVLELKSRLPRGA